jgi:sirohydrochlorin ferrochelatase
VKDIESKGNTSRETGEVLLTVAHGTRDPAGIDTVSQIVHGMRAARPVLDVRLAWIELVPPDVRSALAAIPSGRPVVLAPLLLSSGYHDRVDLPAVVRAVRPDSVRAPVLGPDRLLATALADRLAEAGRRPADAVVLAAAGSSDPAAVAAVREQAALLAEALGVPVTVGFGSAASPDVPTAVAAARAEAGRVAIAPYLLAPGFFAARLGQAGADLVAAPLGAHPAVVELVLRRFAAAR